jgi:hypothetical protein
MISPPVQHHDCSVLRYPHAITLHMMTCARSDQYHQSMLQIGTLPVQHHDCSVLRYPHAITLHMMTCTHLFPQTTVDRFTHCYVTISRQQTSLLPVQGVTNTTRVLVITCTVLLYPAHNKVEYKPSTYLLHSAELTQETSTPDTSRCRQPMLTSVLKTTHSNQSSITCAQN